MDDMALNRSQPTSIFPEQMWELRRPVLWVLQFGARNLRTFPLWMYRIQCWKNEAPRIGYYFNGRAYRFPNWLYISIYSRHGQTLRQRYLCKVIFQTQADTQVLYQLLGGIRLFLLAGWFLPSISEWNSVGTYLAFRLSGTDTPLYYIYIYDYCYIQRVSALIAGPEGWAHCQIPPSFRVGILSIPLITDDEMYMKKNWLSQRKDHSHPWCFSLLGALDLNVQAHLRS